ncbi:MAG: hypothetical protein PHO37_12355, partial [Kiritimatiellae bacterium]|nr:hypothetical protein [Kiritimatiellia bacterium]
ADVHFKGWLDNVQVANRAFSASEITALMQQSSATENMLPVGTSLHVAAGAMVDLNGSRQAVAVLTGGGRVTSSSLALAALTVGGENSSDFAGNFDGEIAINKVGTGSLKLSGLHVGSGDITVNSGTLVLSLAPLHSLLASSKIWFDAADATTLTTNATGVVTLWTNKGGAGATLDAVPIAAGAGPTVLPGALNNQPVLSLDATNGLRTAADAGVYGAQNRTLFAVGCRKNNGNMFLAHIGYGSDNQAFGIASQHNLLFGYTWGWGKDITFPARANSVYEIYDYMIENKQSTANLISGKNLLSGSLWTAPATVNTPLYLGSRFNDIGNGNIAEVILFDRALTPRERATIESYLRSKWFAANNTVALAAGTVLDLDSSTLTLGKLSGSGLVTNGTLGVTGTIAPGGTNSVGTLTMAGLTLQGGTLLTDVRTDGSCDLLEVEGPLDLTGFALQIADATQLRTGKSYLIASCSPGELTGTFAAVNLETGGWRVGYNNATGEVRLYCQGLVIMIQ